MRPPHGRLALVIPETRYARTSDRTHVAYKVSGHGPIDMLVMRAWYSNVENEWREPIFTGILRRLGSIGRVVHLDRRGTGLSDHIEADSLPTLEQRVDDMRAVLDAIGSERVVLLGLAHASALCSVFAATYPERTAGLIAWSPPWTLVGRDDQDLTVIAFEDAGLHELKGVPEPWHLYRVAGSRNPD